LLADLDPEEVPLRAGLVPLVAPGTANFSLVPLVSLVSFDSLVFLTLLATWVHCSAVM